MKSCDVRVRLRRRVQTPSFWAILTASTLLLIAFSGISPEVSAQTAGQGAIQGTVTDMTGAFVPNATVSARNQATGIVTTRTTTGDGLYTISPLIPGKYDITVSATGFSTLTQQNIQVDALHTVGVNLSLSVGKADQSITVTEAPPQLETTNATLGAVMETKHIPISLYK